MKKNSKKNEIHIPQTFLDAWQKKLDEIANISKLPIGVILQLNDTNLDVLITTKNKKNPFKPGFSFPLKGTYCEETINSKTYVFIPDASKEPKWMHSVSYERGMVSYLGFPIRRPDGTIFGTICLNDVIPNDTLTKYVEIVEELRDHIESELKSLFK